MAEALLPLIAPQRFEASSAGTQPVGLNPCAVEAMAELGANIAHHRSKHISEFADQQFDYVITVCDRAKESCPLLPGAQRVLHWSFEDPAAAPEPERLATFRRVRDEIADAMCRFLVDQGHLLPNELQCYRCSQETLRQFLS